jgi:hypothetical protein
MDTATGRRHRHVEQREDTLMSGTDYTLTPKLGLFKPIPDADVDQWGSHWNLNADQLDRSVLYDANNSVGINLTPPSPTLGGSLFAARFITPADGVYFNGYTTDGTNWLHLNTGPSAWIGRSGNGEIVLQAAASGAAGTQITGEKNWYFSAKGNVGVGILPPALAAAANSIGISSPGGWTFAWGHTANNYAYNSYYDGTNWRYQNDGFAAQMQAGSQYIWQLAPTGLKDAIAPLVTQMVLDGVGNLTANGTGTFYSILRVNGGWPQLQLATTGSTANNRVTQLYVENSNGSFNMQFVNDANNAGLGFLSVMRSGNTATNINLNATNIGLYGAVTGTSDLYVAGAVYPSYGTLGNGFALYGDSADVNIRFTVDNWRLGFQRSTGMLFYWHPGQYMLWTVDSAGSGWFKGNVDAVGWVRGADVHVNSRLYCNDLMNYSGVFYVAGNYDYYLRRASDGNWNFVEGGTVNCQISADGYIRPRAGIIAGPVFSWGNVYALNDWTMYFGGGGQGRILQFASNWYWDWNGNDGQCSWVGNGVRLWQMRQSPDNLSWNPTGTVGGYGAYQNFSDRRAKRDIEDAPHGLNEILKLRPVSFIRIDKEGVRQAPRTTEIGFIAQDVRDVLPEAVVVFGSPLPDGTGGMDDDEPTLGMSIDPIVAALVNAVKQMHAEIQTLKGQRA